MQRKLPVIPALIATSAFSLLVACVGCTKQDNSTATPERVAMIDTTEIVGITLGSPVVIPECRKEKAYGMVTYAFDGLSYPCFKDSFSDTHKLEIAPDLPKGPKHNGYGPKIELSPASVPDGVSPTVEIMMLDGIPAEIRFATEGVDVQERVYALLTAKYGTPTTSNVADLQNGMGARYSSIEATWRLPRMTVVFYGMVDDPRAGFITASTPTAAAFWASREEKRAPSF